MKLMIFEWLCGGGLWADSISLDENCSMQFQGKKMLAAVVDDFLAGGMEVELPLDERLAGQFAGHPNLSKHSVRATDNLRDMLVSMADQVDFVLMIAPESGNTLVGCLKWLKPFHEKLIGPDLEFAVLASNKLETCRYLTSRGFDQHPQGVALGEFLRLDDRERKRWSPPLILKPIDGAGSEGVQVVYEMGSIGQSDVHFEPANFMVEPLVQGTPMSVSVLCGEEVCELLPPTIQLLDDLPIGHYTGAGYPVDAELARRARRLANDVMNLLPHTRGYIGLDLVIGTGDEPDWFVEVNPRLTMSYLKLREIMDDNLAMQMLETAR